jgi:hypothetical protein
MAASGVELLLVGRAGKTLAERARRESSVEVCEIRQDILSVSQIIRYGLDEIPGFLE